jgi:hypothetical protein
MSAHICIGGPADGEYRAMDSGCHYVRVAVLPAPESLCTPNSDKPKNTLCNVHEYLLSLHQLYGFAWIYKEQAK